MIINILGPIIGYLIGSILPGYFFGKIKGLDIRKVGDHYAGTMNVYRQLGLLQAIPTAIFDTLKGVFVIMLTQKLGASFVISQVSGLLAIAGHVLPFYIGFRGGQGVACAVGIMLFYLWKYFFAGGISLYSLTFIGIIVLILWYVVKAGSVLGLIILPLFTYSLIANVPRFPYNPFFVVIIAYILGVNIFNVVTRKLFVIKDEEFLRHWWRVAARPGAVYFVIFYLTHTKKATLELIGYVAIVFIILDFVRFLSRRAQGIFRERIKMFFKPGEAKRFSSMTLFLVASFIVVLLFNKPIAVVSLIYLIFGDIFGKIFGLAFGRHRLFEKTLEGSLAYFSAALICAYIIQPVVGLPYIVLLIGAFAATIAELLPIGLDDNFTVGILTGVIMVVFQFFFY